MAQHLKTVCEHGIVRPLEPVRLQARQEVMLVLEAVDGAAGVSPERKSIRGMSRRNRVPELTGSR